MVSRLLTISEAAAHCGLSVAGYRACQKSVGLPGPVPGMKRYDLAHINKVLDRLSGITQNTLTDYDNWKAIDCEDSVEAR